MAMGAFQKSELTGRTIAELVILTMNSVFSKIFIFETVSPSCMLFLEFD